MNEPVIVDTSSWVRFFRKGKDKGQVADEVERLVVEELAHYTEPIYLELAVGARAGDGVAELEKNFDTLPIMMVGEDDWHRAWEMAFTLRRKGLRVDSVDLIVAATAIGNGAIVFHHDKHFRSIAGVAPFQEYSFLQGRK